MIELTVTELVIIGVVYCVALLALAVSAGLIVGAGLLGSHTVPSEPPWCAPPSGWTATDSEWWQRFDAQWERRFERAMMGH